MCDPAFDAVVRFLQKSGLPATLTMDRDVRWVGSATQRDFPSALLQFLSCVGVQPNVLPPHHRCRSMVTWNERIKPIKPSV
jgi:hypothetical protein